MALDDKTLELLGIAASIGAECSDQLDHYLNAAREAGATDDEINETLIRSVKVRSIRMKERDDLTNKIRKLYHHDAE